jgi:pyruvate kinase
MTARHTKIVATVGPACESREQIDALIRAGVDVFRLNFSHGTHKTHERAFRTIREASESQGRRVGIMQDLSGPKIRTGSLPGGKPLDLAAGDELRIAAGDAEGKRGWISTPFTELVRSARPGNRLLLDDGKIELRVTAASGDEITTTVVTGGSLGEHKGINAPGVTLPASAITSKDEADLRFGLELGVDFVALSFVQTAKDIARARDIMSAAGKPAHIIAKIERPAAVENLEGILELADGVMVARGDLGLEMPLEQVPRVQKRIIRTARAMGRPSIVATQVLESMREDPRPTRAEVSDAANAVDEGADAIMLAGETAAGAHPVRAVETLAAVIDDAELMPPAEHVRLTADPIGSRHGRALGEAAVTLSTSGQAAAIVAVTREGKTARLLSALRPAATIYAATGNERVAGTLALLRGVVPVMTDERHPEQLERVLLDRGILAAGTVVVFINVSRELDRIDANFLNVQRLG